MRPAIRGSSSFRHGERLLGEAATRSQVGARRRRDSLIAGARPIMHSSLAAAAAWLVARDLIGHPRPFFAPIAAVITLGLTIGERRRRALETAFGVALGIGVADVLIRAIGGGWAAIALVVAVAMTAALLLGGRPLLVSQAATSAVLVATLQPPEGGITFDRFVDALTGGFVALAVATLVLPVRPVEVVRRAAEPLLDALAATLAKAAEALERRDGELAEDALLVARDLDDGLARLRDSIGAARESTRLSPRPRRARSRLERWEVAARHIEFAVHNARVIARGAVRAIALDDSTPAGLPVALRRLSLAIEHVAVAVDAPDARGEARDAAVAAAVAANEVLSETGNMSALHLVAQARSTAVDVLRAIGYERGDAEHAVRGG